ncbi:MAG TPA: hypothetical protein VM656_15005 [Pyrinomonadaceae bacterium]|nr:hypothetical protein [Pyrinomonadaceae bacterium]
MEKHLAPVVTELHRLVNELLVPGATSAEEWGMDMCPAPGVGSRYTRLVRPVHELAKHVVFDGSEYFSLPKELLRSKQVKVHFAATVYAQHPGDDPGTVEFRLVRDDGMAIANSHIATYDAEPYTYLRVLPFGDADGCVAAKKHTYYLEGCSPFRASVPVCRRFSMSFIYI